MSGDTDKQGSGPTHDPFAIQQFQKIENARSLFEQYAPPALVQSAQWETLKLHPGQFVDERLQNHFSDLLFSVEVGGEPVLLYLLFEHKSWVDVRVRLQLLIMMAQIWDRWYGDRPSGSGSSARLPFILPFVLYHEDRSWKVSKQFADFVSIPEGLRPDLEEHVPKFEHLLVDLHGIRMEEIRGTVMVRLILGLLKAVAEGREEEWRQSILEPSLSVVMQPDAIGFIRSMFEYLTRASEHVTPSTFRLWADRVTNDSSRKDLMTLAERFVEEGRQEGRQEGQRRAVVDLLELRLGEVPAEVREMLALLQNDAGLKASLRLSSAAVSYPQLLADLRIIVSKPQPQA